MPPDADRLSAGVIRLVVRRIAASAFFGFASASAAAASFADGDVCAKAAQVAADETGVPFDVLMAISLTETGRKQNGRTTAWPWTVNTEGKGTWFDDYGAALSYARQSQAAGARSFDVGCFQINYRWHGQHFASLDAMFDPLVNARYAARFLSNLHAEYGDWQQAAGAFHSRTEVHAARYRKIFAGFRSEIGQDAGGYIPDQPPARQVTAIVANAFPLLRTGASRGGGSLVPLDAAPRPLFDLGG